MKVRISSRTHRMSIIILASCVLVSVIMLIPGRAPAHAPSNVTLLYDNASKTLSVTITHNVSDPKSHYVSKVTIMSTGTVFEDRVIQTHTYKDQPTPNTFTYTYTVDATPGTRLSVEASCNYIGSDTGTVTVP